MSYCRLVNLGQNYYRKDGHLLEKSCATTVSWCWAVSTWTEVLHEMTRLSFSRNIPIQWIETINRKHVITHTPDSIPEASVISNCMLSGNHHLRYEPLWTELVQCKKSDILDHNWTSEEVKIYAPAASVAHWCLTLDAVEGGREVLAGATVKVIFDALLPSCLVKPWVDRHVNSA